MNQEIWIHVEENYDIDSDWQIPATIANRNMWDAGQVFHVIKKSHADVLASQLAETNKELAEMEYDLSERIKERDDLWQQRDTLRYELTALKAKLEAYESEMEKLIIKYSITHLEPQAIEDYRAALTRLKGVE